MLPVESTATRLDLARLTVAAGVVIVPLGGSGFFPAALADLANMPDALPPTLGRPPSVVAPLAVWITLAAPLLLGIGLVFVKPWLWRSTAAWLDPVNRFTRMEWLFRLSWWGVNQTSDTIGTGVRVIEGAGYMGWVLVFGLMAFFLLR
jgi:hypothetical protein